MLKKIFTKAKSLTKNKKGVSQFVEMLMILGVTVAVGTVVISIIWNKIDSVQEDEDQYAHPAEDESTGGTGGSGEGA